MKNYTFIEWEKEATKRFGNDFKEWKLKCVSCGHVQSITSILKNNPKLEKKDVVDWFFMSCEGRVNGKGIDAFKIQKGDDFSKDGCNWTLGGLFEIHEVEVTRNGVMFPIFDFAE